MANPPAKGPFRSAAFRFALLLASVFAAGSVLLLATVERQIGHYAAEATSGMLRTEATILTGEYQELGLSGLIDAMQRHTRAADEPPYSYLLTDSNGRRLFGQLPAATAVPGYSHTRGDADGMLETYGTRLPNGLFLVVATDNFDIETLRARLDRFTLLSGIGITLFALLGGFLTGRLFLRRVAAVNLTVDRIIAGETSERLPDIGFGPEFDGLTRNVNRMLDRNAAAMEALRQVSTDIAHDMRTPLSRLHQQLEALHEASPQSGEIDAAIEQTDELLKMFEALLRIGTVEGGVGRQRFVPVEISKLLDRIHLAYLPAAEDSGHNLVAEHEPNIVINGDGQLLSQLFTNLIENAIVHTPARTTIRSRLVIEGGAVIAEVSDDGPGIPPAEREKVFRRFYRLDASRNTEGAGLGLALVAAVASLHNASCTIVGDCPGMAVRVIFTRLG